MLDIINKAVVLLPVLVAINVALGAIGAVFDAIAKAKGHPESKVGAAIVKVCALIKKVADLATGNLPH
jgi:hypothetical protein